MWFWPGISWRTLPPPTGPPGTARGSATASLGGSVRWRRGTPLGRSGMGWGWTLTRRYLWRLTMGIHRDGWRRKLSSYNTETCPCTLHTKENVKLWFFLSFWQINQFFNYIFFIFHWKFLNFDCLVTANQGLTFFIYRELSIRPRFQLI